MSVFVHDLLLDTAAAAPGRTALSSGSATVDYGTLASRVEAVASAVRSSGVRRSDRVAVWMDKRIETVSALLGAACAGAVFVPVNPALKPEQVAYLLQDCRCTLLLTTPERCESLRSAVSACPDLRTIVVTEGTTAPQGLSIAVVPWSQWIGSNSAGVRVGPLVETDMAAILYTSGSTGHPKGVVLSHRNMVAGARSVAAYLENVPDDRLLAVLPLSFDYGLSQLTTAFSVGASVVLHDYLLPGDVVRAMARHRITGLAAVPPLWIQLAALDWPSSIGEHLRYFTNSGGAMPTATLAALRGRAPRAKPFLMYGLTEAFRSTYLPPDEVDRRPTSMGKAIPNVEVHVVREDGTECAPGEAGELVHRGPLVSLGYWNDPQKTAERFRPAPGRKRELVLTEVAVWSGDTVRCDEDGFLYFIGRRDEMIKTSGYRVSPTEIEEVLYRTGRVGEVAAFGIEHRALGHAIVVVAQPSVGHPPDTEALLAACRSHLPQYMLPARVDWVTDALPRNANGKIDRKRLANQRASLFIEGDSTS